VTTPGGVPNLPHGALTLDTLASKTQDMSGTAMKNRAVERFPSIFDTSTGLSPASDFTPFGILTSIWAQVNSLIANADPADVQGPDDIPQLVLDFIEGLPFVGQFVSLLAAILGTYDGDDTTLLTVQEIFAPIRALISLDLPNAFTELINRLLTPFGQAGDFGSFTEAFNALVAAFTSPLSILTNLGDFVEELFGQHSSQIAGLKAQINALRLSLDPAITDATGAYDDCKTADNFTEVIGTLEPTGWGAFDAHTHTEAHYNTSPKTNRHGAGIKVKSKKVGITRVRICSDNAMSNYVALELEHPATGPDVVRVRTGTSPTDLVTQKSFETNIPSETFWEIFYEPFDETSPTSNTFHVFSGGEPVLPLRWKDDGNIVIHPEDPVANPPRVGVTVNGLGHATRRGFAVTDFTWYDWQGAAPQ
jgi:hypothetical protein